MKGTDIYYISGPRIMSIGWGQLYPEDLTADSIPNPDEWGPDNYWSKQAYIDWFTLNVNHYGYETAKSKMYQAIDTWGLGGADEETYCLDIHFVNFFAANGIDVSTATCKAINTVGVVFDDIGNVITNVTHTASSATSVLKYAVPIGLVAGLLWLSKSENRGKAYDEVKRYSGVKGKKKKRKR